MPVLDALQGLSTFSQRPGSSVPLPRVAKYILSIMSAEQNDSLLFGVVNHDSVVSWRRSDRGTLLPFFAVVCPSIPKALPVGDVKNQLETDETGRCGLCPGEAVGATTFVGASPRA